MILRVFTDMHMAFGKLCMWEDFLILSQRLYVRSSYICTKDFLEWCTISADILQDRLI